VRETLNQKKHASILGEKALFRGPLLDGVQGSNP
jgi:hypothetical protein